MFSIAATTVLISTLVAPNWRHTTKTATLATMSPPMTVSHRGRVRMAPVVVHCLRTPGVFAVSIGGSIDGDSTCLRGGGTCATRTHAIDSPAPMGCGSDEECWPTIRVHAQCADQADSADQRESDGVFLAGPPSS